MCVKMQVLALYTCVCVCVYVCVCVRACVRACVHVRLCIVHDVHLVVFFFSSPSGSTPGRSCRDCLRAFQRCGGKR